MNLYESLFPPHREREREILNYTTRGMMDKSCIGPTTLFRTNKWKHYHLPDSHGVIQVAIMPSATCLYIGLFTKDITVFRLPRAEWDMTIDSMKLASIVLQFMEKCGTQLGIGGVLMSAASVKSNMVTDNMYREVLFIKQNTNNAANASMVQVLHSQSIEIDGASNKRVSFIFYIMTKCTEQPLLVQVKTGADDNCSPPEGYQPANIAVIDDKDDPRSYMRECLFASLPTVNL